jgi:hypothetical protein
MITDSIQDSTRVVVGESRHGGVLPGTRAEMWRDVFLIPGADVRGPVWGNVVAAEGPGVRVRESVYARGAVRVTASEKGGQEGSGVVFDGCVSTPDAVQIADVPFRTRFCSNVYAGTVHLHNAIVYGNVYARSAVIRNSVVLGGVFVAGRLTVADSVLSTFRARAARLEGLVSLLFPVACAEEPMQLAGDLRALSFWTLDPSQRGEPGHESGVIPLGAADIHAIEGRIGEEEPRTYHMLSVDQRLLDTQPLLESFRANRRAMEGLAMVSHLAEQDAKGLIGGEVGRLEEALFDVVRSRDLPVAVASRPLAEIAARSEVLSALREYMSAEVARGVAAHGVGEAAGSPAFAADGLSPEVVALFEPGPQLPEPVPAEAVPAFLPQAYARASPSSTLAFEPVAPPPSSTLTLTMAAATDTIDMTLPAARAAAAGSKAGFEEDLGASSPSDPLALEEDLTAPPDPLKVDGIEEEPGKLEEDGL